MSRVASPGLDHPVDQVGGVLHLVVQRLGPEAGLGERVGRIDDDLDRSSGVRLLG